MDGGKGRTALVAGPANGAKHVALVGMGPFDKLKAGKATAAAFKSLGDAVAALAKQSRAKTAAVWLPEEVSASEEASR